jgi:hypothetical protein
MKGNIYILWYIWYTQISVQVKSTSIPQINIHWRHYLKSWSDLRVFSNQRPFQILRSMVDLLVRGYASDVNRRSIWELNVDLRIRKKDIEIRHVFEDWTSIRGWMLSGKFLYCVYVKFYIYKKIIWFFFFIDILELTT